MEDVIVVMLRMIEQQGSRMDFGTSLVLDEPIVDITKTVACKISESNFVITQNSLLGHDGQCGAEV